MRGLRASDGGSSTRRPRERTTGTGNGVPGPAPGSARGPHRIRHCNNGQFSSARVACDPNGEASIPESAGDSNRLSADAPVDSVLGDGATIGCDAMRCDAVRCDAMRCGAVRCGNDCQRSRVGRGRVMELLVHGGKKTRARLARFRVASRRGPALCSMRYPSCRYAKRGNGPASDCASTTCGIVTVAGSTSGVGPTRARARGCHR